MNRLATMIQDASQDALYQVSLESYAATLEGEQLSMESTLDELNDYLTLATGLESIVLSMEAFDQVTVEQHTHARTQALGLMQLAGMDTVDAERVFPSLEAETPVTGWQKFKAFLMRLWEMIKQAAKNIWTYIDNVFKKTSVAEKAALVKLRVLRAKVGGIRNALTIQPAIPLRPVHRYLINGESHEAPHNLDSIKASLKLYRSTRSALQVELPKQIEKVNSALQKALDSISLKGDAEAISQSIESKADDLKKAVAPMFPDTLRRELGLPQFTTPLIYDRELEIGAPTQNPFTEDLSDGELKSFIQGLGVSIVQSKVETDIEKLGEFKAAKPDEIELILRTCESLINESFGRDLQRQWAKIKSSSDILTEDVNDVVTGTLRLSGLSLDAQRTMRLVMIMRQALNRWVGAPYMQINTINVRVVNALLELASDQIDNYEQSDTAEERLAKKRKEEAAAKQKEAKK